MLILDQRLKHLLPKPRTEEVEKAKKLVLEIYENIPSIDCKRCGKCCGTIVFSGIERLIIEEYVARKDIVLENFSTSRNCPALDENNNCIIYPARPMICRLFGVVDNSWLSCPYVQPKIKMPNKLALECLKFCKHISEELDEIGRVSDRTVRWQRSIVRRLKKLKG